MPTQPQDHKPKKGAPFKFKANGKSYTLPLVTKAAAKMSGGDYEDALLDANGSAVGMQMYLVKCLRGSGASPEALAALRAMPQPEYMDVLVEWGEYGDGDGA